MSEKSLEARSGAEKIPRAGFVASAWIGLNLLLLPGCACVTTGYLTQGPPSNLQFSRPVRFVALPPLPIPIDPQPSESSIARLTEQPPALASSAAGGETPAVGSAPLPGIIGAATNRQPSKVDLSIQSSGGAPSDLWLRFFPDGRPVGFDMPLSEPIPFQSPVLQPSSAATYEVK